MSKFIPNSFQVPNAVVDDVMRDLKDVELRCYLTLIRKTTGWNKEHDYISVSQFAEITGKGKTAIIAAMKTLQQFGLVIEVAKTKIGVKCYALNVEKLTEWGSESEPQRVQKVNGSNSEPVQKVNRGGSESEPQPVQKVNTQNTNIKTHSIKHNNTQPPKRSRQSAKQPDLKTLTDLGVDEQVAKDWLTIRQFKRLGALTATALNALQREAQKANLTTAQAITAACENSWGGFKADWLLNRMGLSGISGSPNPNGFVPTTVRVETIEAGQGGVFDGEGNRITDIPEMDLSNLDF